MAVYKSLEEKFSQERFLSEVLYEDKNGKVLRFYLKKGQEVKPHTSPSSVFITLLKGKALFYSPQGEREVDEGGAVFYEPGEPHGFRALEDSVFEATICPPPSARRLNLSRT
jgi:quercetin dioxygenase-like cupin family protein